MKARLPSANLNRRASAVMKIPTARKILKPKTRKGRNSI